MAQSVPAGAPAALNAKVSATVPLASVTTEALGLSRAAKRELQLGDQRAEIGVPAGRVDAVEIGGSRGAGRQAGPGDRHAARRNVGAAGRGCKAGGCRRRSLQAAIDGRRPDHFDALTEHLKAV